MIPIRAKRDSVEAEVVTYARSIGATVALLSAPNLPDAIIGFCGINYLCEFKSGKGELREGQAEFRRRWNGAPVYVLRSVKDLVAMLFPGRETK